MQDNEEAPVPFRDPCHGIVTMPRDMLRLVDTSSFQRLRRIQQLSLASLVFPSAVHTRFAHSIGAFHLANRALRSMKDRGELSGISKSDQALIPVAALLHDIGKCAPKEMEGPHALLGMELAIKYKQIL